MAAPSISGITNIGTFETGTNVGTITVGSGSVSATQQYQNPSATEGYIQKAGIDDGLCNAYLLELFAASRIWGGIRFSVTQLTGSATAQNFSSQKFILHIATNKVSETANRSNDGARLRVYSNSGFTIYREYRLYGGDGDFTTNVSNKKNDESWMTLVIDLTDSSFAVTTVGVFDASTIHGFELLYKPSAYASSTIRYYWHDRFLGSNGMALLNGEVGNPGVFDDFYQYADVVTAKGFLVPNLGSAYSFKLPITIGNGSTLTRFDESDKFVEFAALDTSSSNPQLISLPANFLGLTINTSASDYVRLLRCSVTSANKWQLNVSGSSSATFIWSGGVWSNIGTNSIGGAASPDGVIFSGCDRLNFGASRSITNCTITTSTDSVAAFDWLTTHTIAGTSFTNNTTPAGAMRINAAGTYNLSANTFTGNTKNFNITATTGTVTINVDAASTSDVAWASSYITAGATVVINSATTVTLQVTNCAVGASVSIRRSSDNTSIASGTANGSGIYSTTYSYDGTPFDVVVRARLAGYVPYQTTAQINSGGLNIPAQMPVDTVFVA